MRLERDACGALAVLLRDSETVVIYNDAASC
jgi:hypothetical protein